MVVLKKENIEKEDVDEMDESETVATSLRLPKNMDQNVEALASLENRSKHGQILTAVKEMIAKAKLNGQLPNN